jgi:hypothetical protein
MRPHVIIRKKAVGKFIPLGRTQLGELIKQGLLKVVPLSPSGRAVGITMRSIIKYQRDVMGLQPLPGEEADSTAEAAEQHKGVRHD